VIALTSYVIHAAPTASRLLARPLLLALALCACGPDVRRIVIGDARGAASASGFVDADEVDGGMEVTLHLQYLHPPAAAGDGFTQYVAWFQGPGGQPVRGGALQYNAEERTGDLTATAPFTDFTVKVTAERDAKPLTPSATVIASQSVRIED
jgi:hypothetical protein